MLTFRQEGTVLTPLCGAQGVQGAGSPNYALALQDSMLFYQAQKSGALIGNQGVYWRASSAITDSPVGGFYLGPSMHHA